LASSSVCRLDHAPETSFTIESAILCLKSQRQWPPRCHDGGHVMSKVGLPHRVSISISVSPRQGNTPARSLGGSPRPIGSAPRRRQRERERLRHLMSKVTAAVAAPRGHVMSKVGPATSRLCLSEARTRAPARSRGSPLPAGLPAHAPAATETGLPIGPFRIWCHSRYGPPGWPAGSQTTLRTPHTRIPLSRQARAVGCGR
jgi:hypothetical protein